MLFDYSTGQTIFTINESYRNEYIRLLDEMPIFKIISIKLNRTWIKFISDTCVCMYGVCIVQWSTAKQLFWFEWFWSCSTLNEYHKPKSTRQINPIRHWNECAATASSFENANYLPLLLHKRQETKWKTKIVNCHLFFLVSLSLSVARGFFSIHLCWGLSAGRRRKREIIALTIWFVRFCSVQQIHMLAFENVQSAASTRKNNINTN